MQNINHTYKVGTLKQMNIKNRTFYFYNDLINLESFDSSLLKIGIYNIGYITIKKIDDYRNINSVNPLYLRINHWRKRCEQILNFWLCRWK